MPTYEYECEKCGLRFEVFQSITAEPLTRCKNDGCDGKVRRLLSPGGGFIFKGSGFYITDYRSDSYKKAAKSEGASSSSGASESSKKSEASSSTSSSNAKASTSSGGDSKT